MLKYIIPDAYNIRNLNFYTLNLMNNIHPEWFRDNIIIDGAYGILHPTIFSGGRNMDSDPNLNNNEIEDIVNTYNQYGIEYRLVFTNKFLDDEYLTDYWANEQLKIIEKYSGAIIVASKNIEDYVKNNYPSIKLVSSITKCLSNDEEINFIKDNKDNYKLIVLNTSINKNLDKIPKDLRKYCEILINDCCPPNCKNKLNCYGNVSLSILGEDRVGCANPERIKQENQYQEYKFIKKFAEESTIDEVLEMEKLGYEYFKLCGRNTGPILMILYYADYLIKPEYREEYILSSLSDGGWI